MVRKSVLLLAFFASSAVATPRPPHPITTAEKDAIRATVSKDLSDPESARFRWLSSTGADDKYCGFVNAKNRYGGYVGFVPFLVMLFERKDGSPVALPLATATGDPTAPRSLVVNKMCTEAGIDLAGPTSEQ